MHDLLVSHGLPSLFFLSFLASTLIPLGSWWCSSSPGYPWLAIPSVSWGGSFASAFSGSPSSFFSVS